MQTRMAPHTCSYQDRGASAGRLEPLSTENEGRCTVGPTWS